MALLLNGLIVKLLRIFKK